MSDDYDPIKALQAYMEHEDTGLLLRSLNQHCDACDTPLLCDRALQCRREALEQPQIQDPSCR